MSGVCKSLNNEDISSGISKKWTQDATAEKGHQLSKSSEIAQTAAKALWKSSASSK